MDITLNIGTGAIRLLAVSGRSVKKWTDAPLEPGLVRDGVILEPAAVAAVINDLFKTSGISRDRVTVCLSGLSFTYRTIDLPRMKSSLVAEAVERCVRREIPAAMEELYLSWQVIGARQEQMDYFVLGVARKPVDALVQTLTEAGVKPYRLDLKQLALARAANRAAVLAVSLEPDYFDIVIVNQGFPAIMHAVTPRGPDANIADNVQRLADEISRTVEFYNGSHPETPIDSTIPLLLTGELTADADIFSLAAKATGYEAAPLIPALEIPRDFPLANYAVNMGLALPKTPSGTAAGYHDIDFNIFAAKTRREIPPPRPSSLRSLLLSVGLAVAVCALGAVFFLRSQVTAENNSLRSELARVSQELRGVRLAADEISRLEAEIQAALAEVDSLKKSHRLITDNEGRSASAVKSITDALPAGSGFSGVDAAGDIITIDGEASATAAVVSYAGTLETKGYSQVRIAEITASDNTNDDGTPRVFYKIVLNR